MSAAKFTTVRRLRTSDDVVSQIREAVLDGRLKVGERLPGERELSQQFGVSRSTLREGLRTLEVLGMIEIRPGSAGGIFASAPQGDHVGSALEALLRFRQATAQELAEFRVSFESETARWAAQRADSDDVRRLREIVQQFSERAEDEAAPWRDFVGIDIAFHEAVALASKNQVREAIMLGIHRALYRASSAISDYTTPPVRRRIAAELAGIAEAIAAHDPSLAVRRMRRHVRIYAELEQAVDSGRDEGGESV